MIYFFPFAISFIITFLTTPNIRFLALKLDVVDKRNHRKIHKKVITKLGGLAIYMGFLGGLVVIAIFAPAYFKMHISQIIGLVICSSLILMLGVYDDFHGSGALIKFFVQIIIALLLIKVGFRLERLFIPGFLDINLGRFSTPLTVLWLVGMTNAINLIDGLDGLAAGIVAIASLFLCLHGFLLKENLIIYSTLALMGANLAFLKYNFYPAKIFMGDTGSLFLGFLVASLAVYHPDPEKLNNLFFFPAFIVLFLPILDTALAIVRRILKRKHIFRSDFSHIHHYCIKRGFNQPQVCRGFYIVTFCLGVISLLVIYSYRFIK